MTNIFTSFGAVWPAIGAVITFGGIMYANVQTNNSRLDALEKNVIYLNTEMIQSNKQISKDIKTLSENQMPILLKMEGRVTTLEVVNQMRFDNTTTQSNTVVVEGNK